MHKNLVKFGRVVFELCERTDEQTYWSQYFAPLPGRERSNIIIVMPSAIGILQMLDTEQGIQWIKAERLPAFLDSDCYLEYRLSKFLLQVCAIKLAFHDADTDTNILARIVARMSACRLACHRNNLRKSRVSDKDPREDVRVGVGVGVVEFQLQATCRRALSY